MGKVFVALIFKGKRIWSQTLILQNELKDKTWKSDPVLVFLQRCGVWYYSDFAQAIDILIWSKWNQMLETKHGLTYLKRVMKMFEFKCLLQHFAEQAGYDGRNTFAKLNFFL